MAREIRDRYRTAAELAADLRRFLDGRQPAASVGRSAPARGKQPTVGDPRPPPTAYVPSSSQPGGDMICLATRDGTLVAKSASDGREVWQVRVADVCSLAASRRARMIAAGLASGSIEVRRVETGELVQSIPAHEGPVASLTFFDDDGSLASSGADGAVRVWDARTARLAAALVERPGLIAALRPLAGRWLSVAWARTGRNAGSPSTSLGRCLHGRAAFFIVVARRP